uniref:Uncharacterized protein n=1 Tax=Knipowitschia caucasica TaxID=637954 RepID=A0AAV2KQP9_KNICA
MLLDEYAGCCVVLGQAALAPALSRTATNAHPPCRHHLVLSEYPATPHARLQTLTTESSALVPPRLPQSVPRHDQWPRCPCARLSRCTTPWPYPSSIRGDVHLHLTLPPLRLANSQCVAMCCNYLTFRVVLLVVRACASHGDLWDTTSAASLACHTGFNYHVGRRIQAPYRDSCRLTTTETRVLVRHSRARSGHAFVLPRS